MSSVTKGRLEEIRQTINDLDAVIEADGYCPLCEGEDYPVDASGAAVERAEDASYWKMNHGAGCAYVALCDLLAEVDALRDILINQD